MSTHTSSPSNPASGPDAVTSPRTALRALAAIAMLVLFAAAERPASAQTLVCGPILSNTTWDIAGSPWELTCDVAILNNATLTIDPGVAVVFNPNTQIVVQQGTLLGNGSLFTPISFASANLGNQGLGVRVMPGSTATITFATFFNMVYGVQIGCCGVPGNPPLVVEDSTFYQCTWGVQGYAGGSQSQWAQITRCSFDGCQYGVDSADKVITDSQFYNNNFAIGTSIERMTVQDCILQSNQTAIGTAGNNYLVTIERCLIDSNTTGIVNAPVVRRCTITNNNIGVIANAYSTIECNNIQQNDLYNLQLQGNSSINVDDNWWGSVNIGDIDAGIFDGFDQAGLGFAVYGPALSGDWTTTSTCQCTTPSVTTQPASQTVYSGDPVTFTVTASFVGAPTYQWRRNNVPLPTWSPRFGFSNTPTLTISPVATPGSEAGWTDAGFYDCVITNVCGTAVSNSALLTVNVCGADFNNDSTVSVPDIFAFLSAWFAGCP
jgi:hypothetical protein